MESGENSVVCSPVDFLQLYAYYNHSIQYQVELCCAEHVSIALRIVSVCLLSVCVIGEVRFPHLTQAILNMTS